MDRNDTLRDKHRLSLVVNVLVFSHLYRLVLIGKVVKFLKGHKVLTAQRRSVERVFYFNLHFLAVGCECVITFHTLSVDKKLGVFLFQHLPAFQLIFCAFFQPVKRNRVNDCYLFASHDRLLAVLACGCGMDRDFFLVFISQCP